MKRLQPARLLTEGFKARILNGEPFLILGHQPRRCPSPDVAGLSALPDDSGIHGTIFFIGALAARVRPGRRPPLTMVNCA